MVARDFELDLVEAGELYDERRKCEELTGKAAPNRLITLHPGYLPTEKVRDFSSAATSWFSPIAQQHKPASHKLCKIRCAGNRERCGRFL